MARPRLIQVTADSNTTHCHCQLQRHTKVSDFNNWEEKVLDIDGISNGQLLQLMFWPQQKRKSGKAGRKKLN